MTTHSSTDTGRFTPPPPERRPLVATRRGERARWLAARTRNAAAHGRVAAVVGAVIITTMLLLFELTPRQVDRAFAAELAAELAALPAGQDTLPLVSALKAARAAATATAIARAPQRPATVPAAPRPDGPAGVPPAALLELQQQRARARQAPLIESYRALADTRVLRDDPRARRLLDSLERVYGEREAYAALNGPDARYAAMTTPLTQLGEQLVRVADVAYASAVTARVATARARAGMPGDAAPVAPVVSSALPAADSVAAAVQRAAAEQMIRAERALADARAGHTALRARRESLRRQLPPEVPPPVPLAVRLLAALVLGVVLGFAAVLWRELRRPTVSDAQELASITQTRVIDHAPVAGGVWARRRGDAQRSPVLDPTNPAWPLLHLAVSSIGDVARYVEIVADHPALAGAVALNLAAVAAHESRATVVVDVAGHTSALVPWLPLSVLTTALSGVDATRHGAPTATTSRWEAPRPLAVGRETLVDIVLPRRLRSRLTGLSTTDTPLTPDELCRLAAHHDLALFATDHDLAVQLPVDTAVVLCAQPGVTSLAWLTRTVRALHAADRRVHAVLLWSAEWPHAT
jgi:hypothetical protein